MDGTLVGLIVFASVIGLPALRVPIAFTLGGVAAVGRFVMFAFRTGDFTPPRAIRPTTSMVLSNACDLIHSCDLSLIPLFVALGHIAYRADITTKIYHAARVWLVRVPGGVAMASVVGCGGFSAITGSSIACASTIGRIRSSEMLRMGYDKRLATASVAAGGTLGSLIPPSVLFIIYCIFTTPEAAAICVSAAVLIGFVPKKLKLRAFREILRETCIQTASIFLIAAAAKIFVALTGVAPAIVGEVTDAQLSPVVLLIATAVIYLIPGMFLDPIGILVLFLPPMIPLVEGYGFDLIWFGVVVITLLKIGLIMPPVGFNVFVIANVVGREVQIDTILSGILRFLTIDVLVLILIMAFPIISLLIPGSM